MLRPAFAVLLVAAACSASDPAPRAARARPALPWTPAVVAHCGSGTPPAEGGGCAPAVDAALAVLARGGDPIDAVVAGAIVLEDDPRYNAGTGSVVRLDGRTVEMDAAVMDSSGRFGAAAGLEEVKNPVVVARAVADTPHRLIAGAGATAFARAIGQAVHDPRRPETLAEAERLRAALVADGPGISEAWRRFDWRRAWNYAAPLPTASAPQPAPVRPGGDTVGVLARSADGRFAAALSTGGWTVVLRGRIGDVPIPGAGLHAGPHGAVAGTGLGEKIIDVQLARTVYGWIETGVPAQEAARRGVALAGGKAALIAITPTEAVAEADPPMAWCTRSAAPRQRPH
ncbi:MAG TPA: isoaspartyl peptidase/L-asparaginase [Kofleriaceae bacterium]|nr:isoaspartyl peptidase/L-asparaginase [Kofleriaceae bacterium]